MSITKFKRGVVHADTVEKTSAYTVVTSTDAGKIFEVKDGNDVTFTLPAIAIGNCFTFIYTGQDGNGSITLSPNAADGVSYKGSATDNKDLILTKATAKAGDYVKIASLDQTVAWQVVESKGVWAKEA
ncbi:hypothetical protein KC850_03510 [Candidatus Kaiserbacteria bacterium]|nr:hypothetical protein [Candidatus Kaiserbacteria bacterium]